MKKEINARAELIQCMLADLNAVREMLLNEQLSPAAAGAFRRNG